MKLRVPGCTVSPRGREGQDMMRDVLLDVWAKIGKAEAQSHPLICHMLDTGAVAERMWQGALRPGLRRRVASSLGLNEEQAGRWVAFWASLHDMGKATPAFQFQKAAWKALPRQLQRLRQSGLSDESVGSSHHGRLGKAVLDKLLAGSSHGQVDGSLALDLSTILSGHHGVMVGPEETKGLSLAVGCGQWEELRRTIFDYLGWRWQVACAGMPVAASGNDRAVLMILAGLTSVADWIASCEEFFPYVGNQVDLDAYQTAGPDLATAALDRAGWHEWQSSVAPLEFARTFGFPPYEMQRLAMDTAAEMAGPGLILIEAPMGLGKTEAAFAMADGLLRRLGHQGIYVALPTQATSNQMFIRFRCFGDSLVASGQAGLELLHSQAILNEQYQKMRLHLELEADPGATISAYEWFAASKRRLLAPLGVGTIDQGLFSVLQTRHFFVRLFGLAGKVIILDEVHAYDTYTSQLLEHLVRWLAAMGCSVVLLSATLPRSKRRELLQAYDPAVAPQDVPYPRITVCAAGQAKAVQLKDVPQRDIQLAILNQPPASIAERLKQALADGGCAAWICNTVQRAQDVYRQIRGTLGNGQALLLHARFPLGLKQRKEDEVVRFFGKEGWGNARPAKAVLVATQVIEQSLDLDFDLMVTDLAPVDLVLQRAGRLHRHAAVNGQPTIRPTKLGKPQLWVLAPPASADAVPDFGLDEWVYERYLLLQSYQCLLTQNGSIRIPQDVEAMIEQVYGGQGHTVGPAWAEALAQAKEDMEHNWRNDEFLAKVGLVPAPDADDLLWRFNAEFPDEDQPIGRGSMLGATRKSRESVRLVCLHRVDGRVCLDAEGRRPAKMEAPLTGSELQDLLRQSVSVTRREVVRHFQDGGVQPPAAWRRTPLLRNCLSLVLENGQAQLGSLLVRLDDELGIVFERLGSAAPEGD